MPTSPRRGRKGGVSRNMAGTGGRRRREGVQEAGGGCVRRGLHGVAGGEREVALPADEGGALSRGGISAGAIPRREPGAAGRCDAVAAVAAAGAGGAVGGGVAGDPR